MKHLSLCKDELELTLNYQTNTNFDLPHVSLDEESNKVQFFPIEHKVAKIEITDDVDKMVFLDASLLTKVQVDGETVYEKDFEFYTHTFTTTAEDFANMYGNAFFNREKAPNGPIIKEWVIRSEEEILDSDYIHLIIYYFEGYSGIYDEPEIISDAINKKAVERIDSHTLKLTTIFTTLGGYMPLLSKRFGMWVFLSHDYDDTSIYTTEHEVLDCVPELRSFPLDTTTTFNKESLIFYGGHLSSDTEILSSHTFLMQPEGEENAAFAIRVADMIEVGILTPTMDWRPMVAQYDIMQDAILCLSSYNIEQSGVIESIDTINAILEQKYNVNVELMPLYGWTDNGESNFTNLELYELRPETLPILILDNLTLGSHIVEYDECNRVPVSETSLLNMSIIKTLSSDCYRTLGPSGLMDATSLEELIIPKFYDLLSYQLPKSPYLSKIEAKYGHPKYDSRNRSNCLIETEKNRLLLACNNSVIPNTVTSIFPNAFDYCTKSALTIPSSVLNINGSLKNYGRSTSNGVLKHLTIGTKELLASEVSGITSLENVTMLNTVETVGDKAFSGCTNLRTVNFGVNTNIGLSAFTNCTNLTTISLPDKGKIGNYAFSGCTNLSNIHLSDNIESIGAYAFHNTADFNNLSDNGVLYIDNWIVGANSETLPSHVDIREGIKKAAQNTFRNCSGLTSCTIPSSLTTIPTSMFYGCSGLSEVALHDNITSIGNYAFQSCAISEMVIPSSVTSIDYCAFRYCNKLSSITIPENVVYIGKYTFSGCTSLPVIGNNRYADTCLVEAINKQAENLYTFEPNTRFIGDYAFKNGNPTSVSEVHLTLPDSVICLEWGVFQYSTKLKSIIIPDSVRMIEGAQFYSCTMLEHVKWSNSFKEIPDRTFWGCTNLTSVTLPTACENIGPNAFGNCKKLTGLSGLESVQTVGDAAFSGCSVLTSVVFGDSLKSIGQYAFSGCSALTSVVLGDSVESIVDRAFYECSNLSSITCRAQVAPKIGLYVFSRIKSSGVLYCPIGSDYSTWKRELPSGWEMQEVAF